MRNTALSDRVKREADNTCAKCHRKTQGVEAHHIRPVGKGGDDTEDNLAVLCPNCHRFAPDTLPPSVDYERLFDQYVSTDVRPEIDLFYFGVEFGDRNPCMADRPLTENTEFAAGVFSMLDGLGGDVHPHPSRYWLSLASTCEYVDVRAVPMETDD